MRPQRRDDVVLGIAVSFRVRGHLQCLGKVRPDPVQAAGSWVCVS
jgi:hypothetical protein